MEQGLVAQIHERKPAMHGGMVPTRRYTGGEQRFDLRSEIDGIAYLRVE